MGLDLNLEVGSVVWGLQVRGVSCFWSRAHAHSAPTAHASHPPVQGRCPRRLVHPKRWGVNTIVQPCTEHVRTPALQGGGERVQRGEDWTAPPGLHDSGTQTPRHPDAQAPRHPVLMTTFTLFWVFRPYRRRNRSSKASLRVQDVSISHTGCHSLCVSGCSRIE